MKPTLLSALLCGLVLCLSPACSGEKSPEAAGEKADGPKAMILSAEQAVARFIEVCNAELEPVPERARDTVIALRRGDVLQVSRLQPRDYQPPGLRPGLPGDDPKYRVIGTLAAARECKNDTWLLFCGFSLAGGFRVILDAVTGKILYLYAPPGA